MSFWGVEVKPGEPFTLKCEELGGALILTQATLGIGKSTKRSILQVNVGDTKPIFICSLLPGKCECFTLNLDFDEEEDVIFSVVGPTSIHLSGYVERTKHDDDDCELDCCAEDIAETESEDCDESEDDSEDDFINDDDVAMHPPSPARNSEVVIEETEEEEKPVIEKSRIKKVEKQTKKLCAAMDRGRNTQQLIVANGKIAALELESEDEDGFPISSSGNAESRFAKLQANTGSKIDNKEKNKQPNDVESASHLKRSVDAMDQDPEPKSNAAAGDVSVDSKKNKKNKKKAKVENEEPVSIVKQNAGDVANVKQNGNTEENTKQSKDKPAKIRTYSNGLIVEEMEMGKPNGRRASPGNKVSVRYTGKLKETGKIFDSNTGSSPFKFRLGIGQVIKGWDIGVEGMRVGDKRRLTIPPTMGYGATGAPPDISPNAWLVFDVELVNVA